MFSYRSHTSQFKRHEEDSRGTVSGNRTDIEPQCSETDGDNQPDFRDDCFIPSGQFEGDRGRLEQVPAEDVSVSIITFQIYGV